MIHVAPCSCELHVRIRELEAELAKDDAALNELRPALYREKTRAEKAEARVAELEADIKSCPNVNHHLYEGRGFPSQPAPGD